MMKAILMSEIRNLKHPDKIKRHFQIYFGIPHESPEKLQLDQLMLNQDSKFDKVDERMNALRMELKQEQKIVRYLIVGFGFLFGTPELVRFAINFLGL